MISFKWYHLSDRGIRNIDWSFQNIEEKTFEYFQLGIYTTVTTVFNPRLQGRVNWNWRVVPENWGTVYMKKMLSWRGGDLTAAGAQVPYVEVRNATCRLLVW